MKAEEERLDQETDKMEDDKERAAVDWAEEEERRELEAMKTSAAKSHEQPAPDPTKDPQNVRWMEEQIQKAKETFGESFGEDIDENFEG